MVSRVTASWWRRREGYEMACMDESRAHEADSSVLPSFLSMRKPVIGADIALP